MALFDADDLGGVDDRVRLVLGDGGQGHDDAARQELTGTSGWDTEIVISESYEVTHSVLQPPGGFSVRCGNGAIAAAIAASFPPHTRFQLLIGNVPRFTGHTDGYEIEAGAGATEVTIHGRDELAPIYDGFVRNEKNYNGTSYSNLVAAALLEVGRGAAHIFSRNGANREIITGVPVRSSESATLDEIIEGKGTSGTVYRQVLAKTGERWHALLQRHLSRAGLVLSATAQGNFSIFRPNAQMDPVYRIVRRRGQAVETSTIVDSHLRVDATQRYAEVLVYGKGGGKKFGRTKNRGDFVDQEMAETWGYVDPFGKPSKLVVFRDTMAHDLDQARFYSLRKIAEQRRQGWVLQYTVAGHTTLAIDHPGQRAVWAPDTLVEVDDEELGLKGRFYVETVKFTRPPTRTTLTLMRTEDLIFGGDE